MNQSTHDLHETPLMSGAVPVPAEQTTIEQSIGEILLQMKQIQADLGRDHVSQVRQLLDQEEVGRNSSVKAFDWMRCKPDKLLHPVRICSSL